LSGGTEDNRDKLQSGWLVFGRGLNWDLLNMTAQCCQFDVVSDSVSNIILLCKLRSIMLSTAVHSIWCCISGSDIVGGGNCVVS
jgi:hypothetical protein